MKYFIFYILKNKFLLFIILSVILSEIYLGWMECLLGKYVLSGNNDRPKLGLVWEVKQKKQIANNKLSKVLESRSSFSAESVSFVCLLKSLHDTRGVVIPYSYFMNFYNHLSAYDARLFFSPYLILKLISEQIWDHVYLKKEENIISVYLRDKNNIVLAQNDIPQEILDFSLNRKSNLNVDISSLTDFNKKIYSADIFFATLFSLPESIQKEIISEPEKILNSNGKLSRVGISDRATSDISEIAVEIEDVKGYHVLFFYGNKKAVGSIIVKLTEKNCPKPLNFKTNHNIRR